jgi:hypothetical protein
VTLPSYNETKMQLYLSTYDRRVNIESYIASNVCHQVYTANTRGEFDLFVTGNGLATLPSGERTNL